MSIQSVKQINNFNTFAMAAFEIAAVLNMAGDALTAPVSQSSARWRILGRISREPQTVSQIARVIGYARQSVQRVADDLAREKLVTYVINSADQRAQLVQLTTQGREALDAIELEQRRWVQRLMKGLDEQELTNLVGQLQVMSAYIRADYNEHLAKNISKKG